MCWKSPEVRYAKSYKEKKDRKEEKTNGEKGEGER